jgi:cobalt/nickel transport system permease protein
VLLHIGTLPVDVARARASQWHRLVPRTRVLCTLMLVFAIALTANGQWATWAVYAVGVGAIALGSRVSLPALIQRVAVELIFLSTVLLGTLFRSGGEVLWQGYGLQITTAGLTVLGSVSVKAFLSLWTLNILILTTSVSSLLGALVALKTPPLLVAIFASMYRYIAVLTEEFGAMRRAATSRNLMGSDRWQRLVVGNMIGALFIRTYERAERVHRAMLSRGCVDGVPPMAPSPPGGRWDAIALIGTVFWIGLGQLIGFWTV